MSGKQKLSASLEDYLETIYLLCRDHGEARSKDIMERLKVTGPSVTEALQLLSEKEMVNYVPYSPITMTKLGEEMARDVLHRHVTLRDFFIEVLGIDRETADEGACKMEHAASSGIIERMVQYTQFLREECEEHGRVRGRCFTDYVKTIEEKRAQEE